MVAKGTKYFLATEPEHFKKCRAVWKAAVAEHPDLGPVRRFGWPTVFAERKGRVIGFLSSYAHPRLGLVAGPMVLSKEGTVFTALRLVEAYHTVLRTVGVPRFWFSVVTPELRKAIERVGPENLGIVKTVALDDVVWYLQNVDALQSIVSQGGHT